MASMRCYVCTSESTEALDQNKVFKGGDPEISIFDKSPGGFGTQPQN